ncbi:hydroxyisourate hydrolase [Microbacterium sp. Mu-80]|uniref:5-hydroxyisourate hydrolase n=1 Tax=Microbacterium bandirmense TaxID=3122050 RepID=A0ABU8LEE8_9MICO
MTASHITTHVLDTVEGLPASDVPVQLSAFRDGGWQLIAEAVTDADGRATQLGPEALPAGAYRLRFDTDGYFAARGVAAFFPEVLLTFVVDDAVRHFHVPLLLSPFAYSTYRGS